MHLLLSNGLSLFLINTDIYDSEKEFVSESNHMFTNTVTIR